MCACTDLKKKDWGKERATSKNSKGLIGSGIAFSEN